MFRMLKHPMIRVAALASVVWLAGCATMPPPPDDGALQREAMAGTEKPVPPPLPLANRLGAETPAAVQPELRTGTGQFIHPTALATPHPAAKGDGAVTFNFENQPVQAVVKAVLGDLLKKNYTIAPGVQGNISFATAEPVDSSQALPILEMLLSWTGNALVSNAGGYVVMPAKDAAAGNLVPGLGASAPAGGLQARLFPLHYISAVEMQKLIKPFARTDSVLLVDPARNLLVLSGTPQELANYASTVRTFDVDWLRGMSVGVFSLEHASVTDLMPKLDSLFGKDGNTPLAGMLRFIPIERTNALVVISTQPDYLHEVGDWIHRIDRGGGNEPQLYVYDVRNIKASDLARYLAQIYTDNAGGGSSSGGEVGPGLTGATIGNTGGAGGKSMGSTAGSFGSSSGGFGGNDGARGGGLGSSSGMGDTGGASGGQGGTGGALINASGSAGGASGNQEYSSGDGSIRISSVDANNQLLVRARPSQWAEIQDAIQRLDTVPLQVQIETRILEVNLSGDFKFGVQWYLQGLAGGTQNSDGSFTPGNPNNPRQGALGIGGNTYVPSNGVTGDALFYSFVNSNLQVALHAMETSGNTKTLSAPSMVVLNNQVAHIQVGSRVPINSTSIALNAGTSTPVTDAKYLDTGVILNVQPRVNPGGLVYLNIGQQVSQVDRTAALVNGNPTISQRELATQVAVQSGQTVLLGGLIQQDEGTSDGGVPGLNRVPILGRLFGTTSRTHSRTELIVLITPRVITSSDDARQITEEYQRKFESLAPLRAKEAAVPTAAKTPSSLGAPAGDAAATPEQLQQQAEAALAQTDYVGAQALALRSWRQGTRHGELCVQNWRVIGEARARLKDTAGAQTADKWMQQCVAAEPR
ncbi:type II secretion system secretin GspD [Dyella lutea]|uniref:Type II secretion system secretin GspD n=1 Tax=Dyella lutea TaxID=2950441 RepID=A0ABT1F6V9_9GAMM|nr:type II secretion system secretin GspD [Dyella lutea]MCP1373087.1 type II secretion system secretin GspD [Dyella lutea]